MKTVNRYYEHSGSIGILGPLYMLIFGAVGTVLLGAIYGYAIFYIPFIYLNFFITLGFGAGVGLIIGAGGRLGKVRNSKALLLFGCVFGILAEYAGWISWIFAYSKQEALLLMPSRVLAVIQMVSETGAWSIFGWTPTGVAIYMIWGIEAIIIIGASTLMAFVALSSTPFCERCNKWIDEEDVIEPLEPVEDPDALKYGLERNDYSLLKSLKKMDNASDAYTQVKLLHCSRCESNFYLTLKSIVIGVDSDNKENKEETDILENLIITAENYRSFKEQW